MPQAPLVGPAVQAAQSALRRGQTTRARLLIYVALGLRGQTPTLGDFLRMSDVLISVDEPALAFSASLKALTLDPDNAHARYNMASAWTHVGDYERALDICDAVLSRTPRDVGFLNQKASALRLLKRYKESLTVLGVVTALAPADAVAWFNVSLVLSKLDRFADALDAARRASVLQSARADPWGVQGQAHEAMGNLTEAQRAYREALHRDRWSLPALLGLQRVYVRQGRNWAAMRLGVTGRVRQWLVLWHNRNLMRHHRAARKRMQAESVESMLLLPADLRG